MKPGGRISTAGVRILDLPFAADREYTYILPPECADTARGDFVIVPFGKANRHLIALVERVSETDDAGGLKKIISPAGEGYSLSEEFLGLAEFMRDTTFCSTGDAVARFIPSAALERARDYVELVPDAPIPSDDRLSDIAEYVRDSGKVYINDLETRYGPEARALILRLVRMGTLTRDSDIVSGSTGAYDTVVFPVVGADASRLDNARTPRAQRELYELICDMDGAYLRHLTSLGYKSEHVRALCKKGLVTMEKREKIRTHYRSGEGGGTLPVLNGEQQQAYDRMTEMMDDEKPRATLLFGVTGSGKTSVIISLCRRAVDEGKTAIVLVPEIGLTWQAVSAFANVFGKRLAIMHSALSDGERFDAYKLIRRGEIDVVIGTRSAVFAPLKNIGLIVIDEEQEHTYKSEEAPRYHARDIAKYRVTYAKSLLVLASATPSIETFHNAQLGVYDSVVLQNRYGNVTLPQVIMSDMRGVPKDDTDNCIGDILAVELYKNLEKNEQSMLFLNKRGYNSYAICRTCGEVIKCPNCSVSLIAHRGKVTTSLVCHYCGYRTTAPRLCPSCSSEHLFYGGYGTQLIEDQLSHRFPEMRIMRMDADSIKGRDTRDDIVSGFAAGNADVLVGTQMIAKGHNFPRLTLVGVIDADSSLYMDDFRANERTFSLITQVVGRAGRSLAGGRAVIQTMSPGNETLRQAAKQDYVSFYRSEIKLRRAFTFPPFCDITTVMFTGEDENGVCEVATGFRSKIEKMAENDYFDVPIILFGPFEMPIYKVKNKYRRRIVIKHKNNKRYRSMIAILLREFAGASGVTVTADINPTVT